MEIFQGEQFSRYIGGTGIDYNTCSQIVLLIYSKTSENTLVFVKVETPDYPNAALLEESDLEAYKLKITLTEEMTKSLAPAIYFMEAKRTIEGETSAEIYKGVTEFLTVKKSMTI